RAARGGVLIKGGAPLEELGSLNAMAFDKTGTLTEGRPRITDVIPVDGVTEEELLTVAVAVESLSDHPLAAAIAERYQDIDELEDLGEIDLHISGCINSCGHHHSGHIGVLGVDKDGTEWYQLTLGGGDGTRLAGGTVAGKVIGPSFAADEIADAIDAVIDTFKRERQPGEHFIDAVKRLGLEPFKTAANAVRTSTAKA
ncbi:MAG: HAD family hydrolase, partial [Roseateles sp.]